MPNEISTKINSCLVCVCELFSACITKFVISIGKQYLNHRVKMEISWLVHRNLCEKKKWTTLTNRETKKIIIVFFFLCLTRVTAHSTLSPPTFFDISTYTQTKWCVKSLLCRSLVAMSSFTIASHRSYTTVDAAFNCFVHGIIKCVKWTVTTNKNATKHLDIFLCLTIFRRIFLLKTNTFII